MKVPGHIREKMHKIAELHRRAADISYVVDSWFIEHGYDIEDLRTGDGSSLEELDYGFDVTDDFCDRFEVGEFYHRRKEKR